jgi:hypothetical protein
MGRRSTFARRAGDFYPTPASAVPALLAVLPPAVKFVECCAGAGDLVRHLEVAGHRCVQQFDLEPKAEGIRQLDVVAAASGDFAGAELTITNPPHSRPAMHAIIIKLLTVGLPSWLLVDANWICTGQAAPFVPHVHEIAVIGRVRWMPETKMTGKDDYAWLRFEAEPARSIVFHPRRNQRADIMAGRQLQMFSPLHPLK